jgi:hypothetical protein
MEYGAWLTELKQRIQSTLQQNYSRNVLAMPLKFN